MLDSILITGGAGFIGSALARRLAMGGNEVVLLDNLHPQVHENWSSETLPNTSTLYLGDVTSRDDWDSVLASVRPSVIVHLAAETGTGQSLFESTRHGSVNVVGTTTMLDALLRHGMPPGHLVLASSRAVYGEGAWASGDMVFYPSPRRHEELEARQWDPLGPDGRKAVPLSSKAGVTPERPASVYAATKLAQEHICRAWTSAVGSRLTILRLQNVFGPGQSLTNPYTGIVALFAQLAVAGKQIELYEDGDVVRDFVFIDDVASALEASIRNPPETERLLDIGFGTPTTIRELANAIVALTGAPTPRVCGKFRDGDVRAASCDISVARQELAHEPVWPVEAGVAELLRWLEAPPLPSATAGAA